MNARQAKVGQRVRYQCAPGFSRKEPCDGVIVHIYPAYTYVDDETGERSEVDARPAVKVDERPIWWSYPDTDRFCPDFAELTELGEL